MTDLYTFSLSNEEVNLLREMASQNLFSLKIIEELKERIVVELRRDDIEKYREALTEELAIKGFKEDYTSDIHRFYFMQKEKRPLSKKRESWWCYTSFQVGMLHQKESTNQSLSKTKNKMPK